MNDAASRTDRRRVATGPHCSTPPRPCSPARDRTPGQHRSESAPPISPRALSTITSPTRKRSRARSHAPSAVTPRRESSSNAGVTIPPSCRRALAVFTRFALECPARARVMTRLAPHATDVERSLNRGLRSDVTTGIRAGKAFCGEPRHRPGLFVMGVVQTAIGAHGRRSAAAAAAARAIATESRP